MRKIRVGMIGSGEGSFVGANQRIAAQLDDEIELSCGVFSSELQRSVASKKSFYLDKSRCYASYQDRFKREQYLSESAKEITDFAANIGYLRIQ